MSVRIIQTGVLCVCELLGDVSGTLVSYLDSRWVRNLWVFLAKHSQIWVEQSSPVEMAQVLLKKPGMVLPHGTPNNRQYDHRFLAVFVYRVE